MKKIYFSEIEGNSLGYLAVVAGLGLIVALGSWRLPVYGT